jgi:hypothetical protein
MNEDDSYFMMSFRYNKITPEAFGLRQSDKPDIFVYPDDQSQWKQRPLYDFGWGGEYGFVRLPVPDFDGLVNLVLHSKLADNRYGAAVILVQDHTQKLLPYCQNVLQSETTSKQHAEFFQILQLDIPLNHSYAIDAYSKRLLSTDKEWEKIAIEVQHYTAGYHSKLGRYMPELDIPKEATLRQRIKYFIFGYRREDGEQT